jgi:hypothetical protein
VWCAPTGKAGPTAQSVSCTTKDPGEGGPEVAMLQAGASQAVSDSPPMSVKMPASYTKFTDQMDLGRYLTTQYHIRPPYELTSCETCHR